MKICIYTLRFVQFRHKGKYDRWIDCRVFKPVSIKHGLRTTDYGQRTTDYGLRTRYKTRTGYKTRTKHYGLGIKYGLKYKTRTEHYGIGVKHEQRFYIE